MSPERLSNFPSVTQVELERDKSQVAQYSLSFSFSIFSSQGRQDLLHSVNVTNLGYQELYLFLNHCGRVSSRFQASPEYASKSLLPPQLACLYPTVGLATEGRFHWCVSLACISLSTKTLTPEPMEDSAAIVVSV